MDEDGFSASGDGPASGAGKGGLRQRGTEKHASHKNGANKNGPKKNGPKKRAPLDQTALKDLALAYAARFATTGAKLEAYLARKIRERGVAPDEDGRVGELDVAGLTARLVELGYVDDDAYARAKSRDLTARGYGARRVEQALWAAGVDENVRGDHAPGEVESRRAAMLLAKKRRFGPYGSGFGDDRGDAAGGDFDGDLDGDLERDAGDLREARRKMREKQVAAMLRAGHQYHHVGFILDANNVRDIEQWLEEAEAEAAQDADEARRFSHQPGDPFDQGSWD